MTTNTDDAAVKAKAKAEAEAAERAATEKKAADEKAKEQKQQDEALAKLEKTERFKERLNKAKAKERTAVLQTLGIGEDKMAEATALLAKHFKPENGNGNEALKEIESLKAENAALLKHFDEEWESVGEELKKLDEEIHASLDAPSVTSREKTKQARVWISKLSATQKAGGKVGAAIKPDTTRTLPDGFTEWFKKEFPIRQAAGDKPTDVMVKSFCLQKGIDPKPFLSN